MKKTLLILTIACVCALGACIPYVVFRVMDNATLGHDFPLNDIPNISNVSASDLPVVASIKRILAPDLNSNAEQNAMEIDEYDAVDGAYLEDYESNGYMAYSDIPYTLAYDSMSEFLQSGAIPEQFVSTLADLPAQEEDGHAVSYASINVNPTQTSYAINGIVYRPEDEYSFDCWYTVELDTHKVISFEVYLSVAESTESMPASREDYMRAYVKYLGLDVLGDWEYDGNRLYSAKANLYINVQFEPRKGAYLISVEL